MFMYILNRLTECFTCLASLSLQLHAELLIEAAIAELSFTAGLAVAGLSGVVTKDKT